MSAIDDFIAEARRVDLETVFAIVGGVAGKVRGGEHVGPCPACGGRDRFSINFSKNVWFCRQYDGGRGGDGLQLVAHVHDFDLNRRADLLAACSVILGRPVPDGGELETEEERQARLARIEARRSEAARKRAEAEDHAARQRERAISQGRGFWMRGLDAEGTVVEAYLKARTGARTLPGGIWENIRYLPSHGYKHGLDERGYEKEIHCGPAMVAPMVDLNGHVTGCHQTWIDMDRPPKYRPLLVEERVDKDGKEHQEILPTKKMRGHKKGSIIPILGGLEADRWMVGEGIETVLTLAAVEQFRADTFYAAAGDLGNIAGPADPRSAFDHPTLKKQDARGRLRPVKVAGPVPKPGSETDCFQLAPGVKELVLLADGDSEFIMTAAAMARAEARLKREGLSILVLWPPEGTDWADLAA